MGGPRPLHWLTGNFEILSNLRPSPDSGALSSLWRVLNKLIKSGVSRAMSGRLNSHSAPTNDFDVETLSSLEDLLDGFVGTLLVVSHDRYFLERVCDTMFGIFGDGTSHDLPRGIDQYLEIRKEIEAKSPNTSSLSMGPLGSAAPKSAAEERLAKKEREKVERQLAKLDKDLKQVHLDMAAASTDYPRLAALTEELRIKEKSVNELEELWLTLAD